MKRGVKNVFLILFAFLTFTICLQRPSVADVGDFETYDSGSSSSSWDSGSSSWDHDYSYSGSGSGGTVIVGDFGGFFWIVIVAIIIIAALYRKGYFGNQNATTYHPPRPSSIDTGMDEATIISMITKEDPLFNKDEFLAWSRDLFIKLQYAWSDRDWSIIRCFESNELFEQHSAQLERYKQNKQINKMERVSVNWAKLHNYKVDGEYEVMEVMLNSKMIDYIIDEETGKVLHGDKTTNKINTYKLTFKRKKGITTKAGETTVNTTNCPNCGAPTEITSSGKCPYCGSVITTGDYNWVLTSLERV